MLFEKTKLHGVFVVQPQPQHDERGFFARTWCRDEFARHGLESTMVQSSISFNRRAGTLRGMHWQAPPHAEAKLVRCTRGSIHDVIADLRPTSSTYKQHVAVNLSAEN